MIPGHLGFSLRIPLVMRLTPNNQERLQLLNEAQPDRPWHSCEEKRCCIACERVFRGTAVEIRRDRLGLVHLACPGCQSPPKLWVRPGNPLVDETAWADWETAMSSLHQEEELAY